MLVYFVEDDTGIAYIIDKTLEKLDVHKQGFQTGTAFLNAFSNILPDLILLDIMLPDVSGLELLRKVRKINKDIPIIIISALHNELDKVTALDAGADDYITKPFGILELSSRIQAKLRKLPENKLLTYGDIVIDIRKYVITSNEQEIILTKKEFDILVYLFRRPEQVLTKEEIFFDVWDTTFMGQTRALDMHVKAIRKKMAKVNSDVRIETEYGVGYKLGKE